MRILKVYVPETSPKVPDFTLLRTAVHAIVSLSVSLSLLFFSVVFLAYHPALGMQETESESKGAKIRLIK